MRLTLVLGFAALSALCMMGCTASPSRVSVDFGAAWKFHLGDLVNGYETGLNDSLWRDLDLPHDWSIEGEFRQENPATPGGGALPGGIGWYRKSFTLPLSDSNRVISIEFDGVYRNSEVWINGRYLGKRPYGYSSFSYDLTPYLNYGRKANLLAVRVDNSEQPNSRWYSGSGIYRNVRLVKTGTIHVDHWGTFITTPAVTEKSAMISIATTVRNQTGQDQPIVIKTTLVDETGKTLAGTDSAIIAPRDSLFQILQDIALDNPPLWSLEKPQMLKAVTTIARDGSPVDQYETMFGIRTFRFDPDNGFFLNWQQVKIKGVCNHHDLGCLGAAVNRRAIERQLEIMKAMGVNAIRTSHNPPAPELLDLCDRMGFIVMDEAFDMWKTGKTPYDYARDWDEWHVRDLEDMVLRDRNHPSVMIWSIGNEVMEQWDRKSPAGTVITRELATIVRKLDPTRPITSACNGPDTLNPVLMSGALDLIGYNYSHAKFPLFPQTFPGRRFLGTETTSALATRGIYDMPSDVIRRWPSRSEQPFPTPNADNTCSSYDNCSAPWGSTHEETWKIVKKYPFLSGMFVWTGFDYLGEPTPYDWPSRSSYFGIVDLAGFPKDAYYMYQSEWTDKPVLHLFPHWNWKPGDTVDVWAYTNFDEVELYLDGNSQGTKKRSGDELHLAWRLPFTPGTLKAVGRTVGKESLTREIKTAGAPAKFALTPDRAAIAANGKDLSFVTVRVLDEAGTLVPRADNLIEVDVSGDGELAGVDNGLQTSHESFKATSRKAFNGLCLAVVRSGKKPGRITLTARSAGLAAASVIINTH